MAYNVNVLPSLKPLIALPFADKLAMTLEIIEHHVFEFPDQAAVSFSGGKDSTLVLAMVRQRRPNIPVVYNDTGVEYPETRKFVAELAAAWQLNLIITHPKKTFWQCAAQYGFPNGTKGGSGTPTSHCCYFLKEHPMHEVIRAHSWQGIYDGVTAVESRSRMFMADQKGTCYHFKRWNVCKIHPILYWTEQEVFDYMAREKIPLNPLYAKGARRVGCMACTAFKTWEATMAAENPKLYAIIKRRKDGQRVLNLSA